MKLTFFQSNKTNWHKLQVELSDSITKYLACGKDFEIEFSEVKEGKTPKQHNGYFRLCSLLVPYFQKEYGQICDKDFVSDTAKLSAGYSNRAGKQIVPKSLTKATLEEMNILIEKLYSICEHFGLKNYELTPYETQSMVEYFNKKEV